MCPKTIQTAPLRREKGCVPLENAQWRCAAGMSAAPGMQTMPSLDGVSVYQSCWGPFRGLEVVSYGKVHKSVCVVCVLSSRMLPGPDGFPGLPV